MLIRKAILVSNRDRLLCFCPFPFGSALSDFSESLIQIIYNIIYIFGSDAQAYGGWCYVLLGKFFRAHLGMSGRVWMNDTASCPPLISKVKILPAPFGKYLL